MRDNFAQERHDLTALRCPLNGRWTSISVNGTHTGLWCCALDRGLELTPSGGELIVLPTYTAMLALRRVIAARGHVQNYWASAA